MSCFPILLRVGEPAEADSKSERIRSWIEGSNLRVGDVQIAEINAPMIFSAEKVHANRATGHEVEGIGP
jgi:hypothetical protein